MIIKYRVGSAWAYIDNVRQVATADIDALYLMEQYDKENSFDDPTDDICSYMEGKKLEEEVIASNKAFTMASNILSDRFDGAEIGISHTKNLLHGKRVLDNFPATAILLYLNDHKEYDTLILITNQKCFLMNDNGQTIERLV